MGLGAGAGSAIGGIASAAGSLMGSSAASSASEAAAQAQLQMYYQTRSDLSPYTQAGYNVLGDLTSLAKSGQFGGGTDYVTEAYKNLPGQMTQAELEKTPGYQFNLSQGLKATQSAAAARGLGVSGASLKGASTYATGLADSTYQNQFNNAQTRFSDYLNLNQNQQGNLTNQYNRLSGVATLGENAAATTGEQGTQAAANYGNYTALSGLSTAAGYTGASNALNSSLTNSSVANLLSGSGSTSGYSNFLNSSTAANNASIAGSNWQSLF